VKLSGPAARWCGWAAIVFDAVLDADGFARLAHAVFHLVQGAQDDRPSPRAVALGHIAGDDPPHHGPYPSRRPPRISFTTSGDGSPLPTPEVSSHLNRAAEAACPGASQLPQRRSDHPRRADPRSLPSCRAGPSSAWRRSCSALVEDIPWELRVARSRCCTRGLRLAFP
jgi:hypothetical protein